MIHTLAYFTGVIVVAYLLKHWYRQASMDEMQWMMLPLAKMLDVILPGHFEQLLNGEWIHIELKILLVKGCSGMNFFIMSFIGYALVFERIHHQMLYRSRVQSVSRIYQQDVFNIICSFLAAWLTALMVNVARIMLALLFVEYPALIQFFGLTDESAHRLAGLIVFIPALFLQIQIGHSFKPGKSYFIAATLMIGFLIVTPLITTNAFNHLVTFIRHCYWLISLIVLGGLLVVIFESKRSGHYGCDSVCNSR